MQEIYARNSLTGYSINGGFLYLEFSNGSYLTVVLDENSGKVMTRLKVGTISNVNHTGIWLGYDYQSRTPLVLHNHYRYGSAFVDTFESYKAGQKVEWKNTTCTNDWLSVITKGLDQVLAGKRYALLDYNCQTFTNMACHNTRHSEDVSKWLGGILIGLLGIGLVSSLAKSN